MSKENTPLFRRITGYSSPERIPPSSPELPDWITLDKPSLQPQPPTETKSDVPAQKANPNKIAQVPNQIVQGQGAPQVNVVKTMSGGPLNPNISSPNAKMPSFPQKPAPFPQKEFKPYFPPPPPLTTHQPTTANIPSTAQPNIMRSPHPEIKIQQGQVPQQVAKNVQQTGTPPKAPQLQTQQNNQVNVVQQAQIHNTAVKSQQPIFQAKQQATVGPILQQPQPQVIPKQVINVASNTQQTAPQIQQVRNTAVKSQKPQQVKVVKIMGVAPNINQGYLHPQQNIQVNWTQPSNNMAFNNQQPYVQGKQAVMGQMNIPQNGVTKIQPMPQQRIVNPMGAYVPNVQQGYIPQQKTFVAAPQQVPNNGISMQYVQQPTRFYPQQSTQFQQSRVIVQTPNMPIGMNIQQQQQQQGFSRHMQATYYRKSQ